MRSIYGNDDVNNMATPLRFVTAASLFDGHDAAINIMRRILQAQGAEVIHLGHNRSVKEIVDAAVQEDAQGIAVSSYQGGHIEYFKYMIDLLKEKGASHIKVYGGGGGVIVPREIAELEDYGVTKIFSPDDGRAMGLDGMISSMIEGADFDRRCRIADVDDPDAVGSELAVQDVADAIEYAIAQDGVDASRVFAVGYSGGGMMALLMLLSPTIAVLRLMAERPAGDGTPKEVEA